MDTLWELFKKTGDIRYFNLIKKLEGSTYGSNKNGNRRRADN